MIILGISAFYHDSAAALIRDGEIIAAAQEERFTRIKHDSSLPINAIKYCLAEAKINLSDINYITFYEKPFIKFERLIETYLTYSPKGYKSFSKAIPLWIKDKLFQKKHIENQIKSISPDSNLKAQILFSEHHQSHAASAFYPSPFKEAVVLTMDGVGEWTTTSVAIGSGSSLKIVREIHFPHSIGLLYSAFTQYLGFKVNSGEYKVMGLAPYGKPKYVELIKKNLINIKKDGSFRLNMNFFEYCTGDRMVNKKFEQLFKMKTRIPDSTELTNFHMDIAASVQKVTEEIVLTLARSLRKEFGIENICLAGGVALNCVANGALERENIFKNIWVQPASGDSGGALGACLASYYIHLKNKRITNPSDSMKGSYLGPSFSQELIEESLQKLGANYIKLEENELISKVSDLIKNEKAIGWFQGRMEYGPRSLGARSIIADARSSSMQKNLNLKVKFRESFRPFAPSVLKEDVKKYFQIDLDSPYMLMVAPIRKDLRVSMTEEEDGLFGIEKLNVKRSILPAITHVDYSARVQSVSQKTNPKFHKLISAFKEKTGSSVLVNTSFNVRGEPIVCTPEDAFNCFMGTDLDALAIENYILLKEDQSIDKIQRYESKFELD